MAWAQSISPLGWPLLLLTHHPRLPLEHFQSDEKNKKSETFPHQTGPKDTQIAARLPEVGAYLGAQWSPQALYKVDGGKPECPLLWGGNVGDEGGDAHAEGDVAPGQGHGEID